MSGQPVESTKASSDRAESPGVEAARRVAQRIEEIQATGLVLGDDGVAHQIGQISVTREKGRFIADLVRSERPRATIEIGMAWGLSTLYILQALVENGDRFKPHVVMDPLQGRFFHNSALHSLRELGLQELVEFKQEPSELLLPQLIKQGRHFDLAFIDGDHRFEAVFTDLRFVDRLLEPGGLVIFDDSAWDAVHLTCRFAETNFGYSPAGKWQGSLSQRAVRASPPQIRAYRKPRSPSYRPEPVLIPFFGDVAETSFIDALVGISSRQLRHIGHLELHAGHPELARLYFKISLCTNPFQLKTYLRLMRTYMPTGLAHMLSARARGVDARS